jgi:hypothetical protein
LVLEVLEPRRVQAMMVLILFLVLLLLQVGAVLVVQLGALAVLLEAVDILLQQWLLAQQVKEMQVEEERVMVPQF